MRQPRSRYAESAKSSLTEAFSNSTASLANLYGKSIDDRVFDPSFVQIREKHFGQLLEIRLRYSFG